MKRTFVGEVLLVVAVLAGAAIVAFLLIASRPEPNIASQEVRATPVRVMQVQPERQHVQVVAMGTVIPARELDVVPQVSGQIIQLNPDLVPGGYVKEGDVLARIDARDYETAVRQVSADVEIAAANLENSRRDAQRQASLFKDEVTSEYSIDQAELKARIAAGQLEATEARLASAKLNLERTVIKSPFNAIVKRESVEIGQLVMQQNRIATLIGTDSVWVQVSVPVSHLPWIELPHDGNPGGARAKVIHDAGPDQLIERDGKVTRLLGDLDTAGRMARLLVTVDDPLGLDSGTGKQDLPLLIDAYVRVEIDGKELESVFIIPRSAIHEGNQIWIVDENSKLKIRTVEIVWKREHDVFIEHGLQAGEQIVTSNLSTPVPGLLLRVETKHPREIEKDVGSD